LVSAGILAAAVVVALVRTGQALAGRIPPMRAGGEAAILLCAPLLLGVVRRLVERATTVTWAVLGLCLVAWGGGVALPLWRVAHPPVALFEGQLGGARREVTSLPAPWTGVYEVRAATAAPEHQGAVPERPYTLRVRGRETVTLTGEGGKSETARLVLTAGARAVVFLELSLAPVDVRLRPAAPPQLFAYLGAGLALLLALLAEVLAFSAWPRGRGLLVATVTASGLFLFALTPDGADSGRALLGYGALTLVAGGLAGGVFGGLAGRFGGRPRSG
jgi:hypothetical protein